MIKALRVLSSGWLNYGQDSSGRADALTWADTPPSGRSMVYADMF